MNPAQALAQKLRVAISDERVLAAIAGIPRDRFVPAGERKRAYENVALPIACEQTISQPLVVARMLETVAPRPTDRVLDVGTGSGYHAALLARLCAHVWTIERHSELSRGAEQTIRSLGIENVTFVVGDGWAGLPDQAPFDAINVAAAVGDAIPRALQEQLSLDGRLVAPVGDTDQHLVWMHRTNAGWERRQLEAVRFVPLVRGEAR